MIKPGAVMKINKMKMPFMQVRFADENNIVKSSQVKYSFIRLHLSLGHH